MLEYCCRLGLVWAFETSCLGLLTAGITGVYHCAQQKLTFSWGSGEMCATPAGGGDGKACRGWWSPPTLGTLGIKLIIRHGGRCCYSWTHHAPPPKPKSTFGHHYSQPSLVSPELPVTLETLSSLVPAHTVIKEFLRIHEARHGDNIPVTTTPGKLRQKDRCPQETQFLPYPGVGLLARDPLPQRLSPLIGQNSEEARDRSLL